MHTTWDGGFPGCSDGKEAAHNARDLGSIPGFKDPLEEDIATHSSTLAWKIPWAEESGGLQSMGSQRVGHDWVTSNSGSQRIYLPFVFGLELSILKTINYNFHEWKTIVF